MGRFLLFLFFALLGWFAWKVWRLTRWLKKRVSGAQQNEHLSRNVEEEILPCQHCGVYSPVSAGVTVEGHFYCGREHAEAAGKRVA